MVTEKTAAPNANSVRGYNVVEAAKRELERVCPGAVSCADIVTLAARDAIVAVGGPNWNVKLGRRDSTTANRSQAETDLPSPFPDLNSLISAFAFKGLNARDMVALSGAHTIGQSQCFLFRDRIYSNGSDVDDGFATARRRSCHRSGGDGNLAPLDVVTPDLLDNKYFKNLVERRDFCSRIRSFSVGPQPVSCRNTARIRELLRLILGKKGIIRRRCSAIN